MTTKSAPRPSVNEQVPAGPGMTTRIGTLMTNLGIAAIPRNYELLFEAISGNPAVGREISALGKSPDQAALDAIALRHGLASHSVLAAGQAAGEAVRLFADMTSTADASRREKAIALQEIEEIAARMGKDPVLAISDFSNDAVRMLSIIQGLLSADRLAVNRMDEIRTQLEGVCSGLATSHDALTHDPITGLANLAALMGRLKGLFEETEMVQTSALLLVRVEKLKEFASSHAPGASEETLKKLASILRHSTKKNDFVARTGTDLFCLLLSDVSRENATTIAGRIAARVSDETFPFPARELPAGFLTLTCGISLTDAATSPAALYDQAGKALAFAVEAGTEMRIYSAEVSAHAARSYRHGAA
jgi:diguanylate cyclase